MRDKFNTEEPAVPMPPGLTDHAAQLRWNERYRRKGVAAFGQRPSQWLVSHEPVLEQQPQGWALDLACGNGRNAIYLAKLGFQVDALDVSDVAMQWLSKRVAKAKFPIHPRVVDLQTASLPAEKYQVIVNFNYLQRTLFAPIKKALLPGGLLFFETFTKDQLQISENGINPAFVLEPNELLRAFLDFRILHYREGIIEKRGGVKKAVASLVARKVA
ncbi:MAG: class I SAM-dependent methyltransferase [bacterium]